MDLNRVTGADLSAAQLYALLRLRVDVFVVEQESPYPDLDGRDLDPDTEHLWLSGPDGEVQSYLRVLREPDGVLRIGRVVTAPSARGAGLSRRLVGHVVAELGSAPCVLDAQTPVAGFYAKFGFVTTGAEFVEDGIPHLPMRREPVPV